MEFFTVPTVTATSPYSGTSYWTGMGDGGTSKSNVIVQAGVYQQVEPDETYFWYEVEDGTTTDPYANKTGITLAVTDGQNVEIHVIYVPTSTGLDASFQFYNQTLSTSCSTSVVVAGEKAGNTADVITERQRKTETTYYPLVPFKSLSV